jgi:transposase
VSSWRDKLPPVSAEELASTPPLVRARMDAVESLLDITLAHVEELNRLRAVLEARVALLEERVGTNSSNSSKPPSSNGPNAPPPVKPPPSGRPKGGQKGHKGHFRALLPPEKVDHVVVCKPVACTDCGGELVGDDAEPLRHQVTEVPEKLVSVTEYQLHELACPCCGHRTRGELPAEASEAMLGPRAQSLVGTLVGQFKMSHRDVVIFFASVLSVAMSPGTVARMLYRVSEAVAESVEAAKRLARQQRVAHADETSWRQGRRKSWLWVMATTIATIFEVAPDRGGDSARALLVDFRGILVVDRWSAYTGLEMGGWQYCWSHLKRDWEKFRLRGGVDADLAERLARETDRLFAWWHWVKQGKRDRAWLQRSVTRLKRSFRRLLEEGVETASDKTRGTCGELLATFERMWTFVDHEGVPPTNNFAEQQIRHGVIWRKTSFGSDSARGCLFAGRILSVVATCRQHARDVFGFLIEAVTAKLRGLAAPSLVPAELLLNGVGG